MGYRVVTYTVLSGVLWFFLTLLILDDYGHRYQVPLTMIIAGIVFGSAVGQQSALKWH